MQNKKLRIMDVIGNKKALDEFMSRVTNMNISRIDKNVKEKIVNLAKDKFCNDYGMTLHFLYYNYENFHKKLEIIENKLDTIIQKLDIKKV